MSYLRKPERSFVHKRRYIHYDQARPVDDDDLVIMCSLHGKLLWHCELLLHCEFLYQSIHLSTAARLVRFKSFMSLMSELCVISLYDVL